MKVERVQTTVYLDKNLLKNAKKLAIDLGVSFSTLVEKALRQYMENVEKKESG